MKLLSKNHTFTLSDLIRLCSVSLAIGAGLTLLNESLGLVFVAGLIGYVTFELAVKIMEA